MAMPSTAFLLPCPFIRLSVALQTSPKPQPVDHCLKPLSLGWIMASCSNFTPLTFSETSTNLDMYLSADNLRLLLGYCCFYSHFRNIFENFLSDVCFLTTIYNICTRATIQPTMQISSDVISLGSGAHGEYSSGKTLPEFIPNLRPSRHEYPGTWRRLC